MEQFEIVITIDPKTGQVESEAHGFKGSDCSVVMDKVLNGLGKELEATPTEEMFGGSKGQQTVRR